MSWETYTLDQLGEISRGRSRHRPRDAEFLYGGPYPFVQTGDVKAAPLYLSDYTQTYSEEGLKQSKLWPKGTLCITIAANIAETSILNMEACFPDSIIGFVADPEKADTKFVKYQFDAFLRSKMKNVSQGAAQDNLSQAKLLTFEFPTPDLPTQKRIAGVLSAYDDLIENNRRRIALLEEAARLVYREWFVHFRFPNHEEFGFKDRFSLGWQRATIADAAGFISRGITPKYDSEANGLIINQKCIRNQKVDLQTARTQSKQVPREKFVQKHDVLVNSTGTGTLGRVAQLKEDLPDTTVDSHVTIVRPKETVDPIWFGCAMLDREHIIQTLGRGATNQTELSKDDLGRVELTIPDASLQLKFSEIIAPAQEKIRVLAEFNQRLTSARDLLLPRLMSGEISV